MGTKQIEQEEAQRERLDDLLQRLTRVLPGLPGFRALSIFGSMAEGRADGYSDIDMIVTTDDLRMANEQLLGLLEEVGPLEFCWALSLRPDEWNPTIVFAEEGYFHKLDIGLTASDAADRTIPEEQMVSLVGECSPTQSRVIHDSRAYYPAAGSVGHFLLGQFIGGSRYVKCRKRGQMATCYRFAVAAADWCMRACFAALSGDHSLRAKLGTEEYRALDALLTDDQGSALLGVLDFSTPEAMDRALCAVFAQLQLYCERIAVSIGETLPMDLFDRMREFFARELAVKNSNPELHAEKA